MSPRPSERRRQGTIALDIFVLDQRLGALLQATMAGADLRPSEYALYSTLFTRSMTPGELSQTLGVPPSTLSGHLAEMQRRGHVRRERNPRDGRSFEIELSESGVAAVERSRASFVTAVAAIERNLNRDIDEIRDVLAEVADALSTALNDQRDT